MTELHHKMARRAEDFEVAYLAADTAEINQTLDDLGLYWASIRTIHAEKFTEDVNVQLTRAYARLFKFIAAGQ